MPRTFKLLKTLGEGAFGAVHLAELRDEDDFVQTLAVKWLHPQWSSDSELLGRLRDEARLLALLSHEHIVRVHGLTRLEGRLAILMEPVDGADLSQVGDVAMPPRAALQVAACVADALDAAWRTVPPGHDRPLRVVHRDIKPSNIMVTTRGAVKVMDFGVARATFDAREAQTRSQQYGTARYMAPERWLDGIAEAPSDVFSLGVTLAELLGGQPLPRLRLSRASFVADLDEALTPLEAWPAVRELVAEMLAFEAEDRPTAAQVVDRCDGLCASLEGDDLARWAKRWVPGHTRDPVSHPADGTELAEEQSAETFAVPAAPGATTTMTSTTPVDVRPSEAPTDLLASRPQLRGGVLGALGVICALALAFAVRGAGQSAQHGATEEPSQASSADAGSDAEPQVVVVPPEPTGTAVLAPVEVRLPSAAEEGTDVAAPSTPSRRRPAPPAPEREVQAPPPAVATSFLTFFPDSSVTTLQISGAGAVAPRRAVAVPQGVQRLTVDGAAGSWHCTVHVGASPARYRVDDTTHTCTPVN